MPVHTRTFSMPVIVLVKTALLKTWTGLGKFHMSNSRNIVSIFTGIYVLAQQLLYLHLFHVTMEIHCIQLKIIPDTQQKYETHL